HVFPASPRARGARRRRSDALGDLSSTGERLPVELSRRGLPSHGGLERLQVRLDLGDGGVEGGLSLSRRRYRRVGGRLGVADGDGGRGLRLKNQGVLLRGSVRDRLDSGVGRLRLGSKIVREPLEALHFGKNFRDGGHALTFR